MTVEQSAAEADVKFRVPNRSGIWLILGGTNLALAASNLLGGRPWLALCWLVSGCVNVAAALAMRTFGVDLTGEYEIVRGFRRRIVPWGEVQAVVSHEKSNGASVVRLVLENGDPVTLRFPTTTWRKSDTQYERDLQCIDQWWQAHRGEAWRPASAEAG